MFCERNFYDVADFQMDINFKVMRIRTRPVFDIIWKIWFPCAIWNIQNSCRNFCPVAEIHIRMIFHLMRISFWIRDFFACFQSFHGYVWKILLIFEIREIFTNPLGTATKIAQFQFCINKFRNLNVFYFEIANLFQWTRGIQNMCCKWDPST